MFTEILIKILYFIQLKMNLIINEMIFIIK